MSERDYYSRRNEIHKRNMELVRRIHLEVLHNPNSPYAGKWVGIANGQVVGEELAGVGVLDHQWLLGLHHVLTEGVAKRRLARVRGRECRDDADRPPPCRRAAQARRS